jgi:Fur family iron response transcriptional regulator
MEIPLNTQSNPDAAAVLRRCGIVPTSQRVLITQTLLSQCTHLSAEDVFRLVNAEDQHVSKATVYNTLGLLARKGVIREVIADPARVFYDPNTSPHHHLYDQSTGELIDVDASQVQVTGLPPLPEGAALQGVDVVIRIRSAS